MVQLIPTTEPDYQTWLAHVIKGYAQDKIDAGSWSPEEALDRSQKEFDELLPDGTATKDNYLYSVHDPQIDKNVGVVWICIVDRRWHKIAFIYDFEIDEQYRRQGYGTQALLALDDKVRELGLDTIDLHVFGHNPGARALYEKVGYVATDITMRKKL
jgi:RimJ/RimL family protein N-acetyltransferase